MELSAVHLMNVWRPGYCWSLVRYLNVGHSPPPTSTLHPPDVMLFTTFIPSPPGLCVYTVLTVEHIQKHYES